VTLARERAHTNWLRDRLLAEYSLGEASPSDLARRVGRPLNVVAYHTRILLDLGFIELIRTERRRGGTAHVYRACTSPVVDDDVWFELPPQIRRMLVRGLLLTVADDSRAAALAGGFDAATSHLSRWPVQLDDTGRRAIADLLRRLLDDFDAIQADADRRGSPERRRVDVALMGFRPAAPERRRARIVRAPR